MPPTNGAAHSPHLLKQTPGGPLQQLGPLGTPPKPTESAGAVPGIGALMSGASLAPIAPSVGPTAGPGSPHGQLIVGGEGPRDIPNEKMGFAGEDMRALRQLDRVFTA